MHTQTHAECDLGLEVNSTLNLYNMKRVTEWWAFWLAFLLDTFVEFLENTEAQKRHLFPVPVFL